MVICIRVIDVIHMSDRMCLQYVIDVIRHDRFKDVLPCKFQGSM